MEPCLLCLFVFGATAPRGARASSFKRFLGHTQQRTIVGRNPLDEWSARRRDLYLTIHNTHNRQTSMPPAGFEPTISAGERPHLIPRGHWDRPCLLLEGAGCRLYFLRDTRYFFTGTSKTLLKNSVFLISRVHATRSFISLYDLITLWISLKNINCILLLCIAFYWVLFIFCCAAVLYIFCCAAVLYIFCCTAFLYIFCCTAVLYIFCCTAFLYIFCCAAVLYIVCCTAVLYIFCCTAVRLSSVVQLLFISSVVQLFFISSVIQLCFISSVV